MRKLVTVETVLDVQPADNADALDVVKVRGWNVVVKKNEFKVGDKVLYFEIDSMLPENDSRFNFLMKSGVRETEVNGETYRGHVLRTARLRGNLSQGLVMPLADFPEATGTTEDIATLLGVVKYELPVPVSLAGQTVGAFPTQFAPKTDAERVQNLESVWDEIQKYSWLATEKIDGSSVTYIYDGENYRVCSRNWELVPREGLTSWDVAQKLGLFEHLEPGMVIQGELVGPDIQGNKLGLSQPTVYIFNVLSCGKFVPRHSWPDALLRHAVPYLPLELPETVSEAVSQVDGMKSSINPQRLAEGVVWHTVNGASVDALEGRDGFKVINNKWLLKNES